MYKILVVDKCCFSRFGLKTWLSQGGFSEKDIIITEIDNLQLAREIIITWQSNLIIAGFTSFLTTLKNILQLSIIHETRAKNTSIILLQSNHHSHIGDVSKNRGNIHILDKSISLNELENITEENITLPAEEKTKNAHQYRYSRYEKSVFLNFGKMRCIMPISPGLWVSALRQCIPISEISG